MVALLPLLLYCRRPTSKSRWRSSFSLACLALPPTVQVLFLQQAAVVALVLPSPILQEANNAAISLPAGDQHPGVPCSHADHVPTPHPTPTPAEVNDYYMAFCPLPCPCPQAANIQEALEAGATTLLIDEDTSATNFMIRDARMQASRCSLLPAWDGRNARMQPSLVCNAYIL
jgi:hypothetical protein